MNEKITFPIEGDFWIPGKSNDKIPGKINIVNKEISLELRNIFKSSTTNVALGEIEKIIIGILSNGELVTLFQCYYTQHGNMMSARYSKYEINYFFRNVHFKKTSKIKFKSFIIKFHNFDHWLVTRSFKIKYSESGIDETVKYKNPKTIKIKILPKLSAEISFQSKSSPRSYIQSEYSIEQIPYLRIKPKSEKTIEEMTEYMRIFQNFLSLAMSTAIHPYEIFGQLNPKLIGERNISVHDNHSEIIFYPILDNEKTSIRTMNVAFTHPKVQRQLSTLLKNLFDMQHTLEPVFRLYFAIIFNRHMYLEQKFLYLAHAIEVYHRLTMKGNDLSKKQHNKRITKIINSVPNKYQDWLNEKLNFSNELILRKRLEKIIKKYSFILGTPTQNDIGSFTTKFVQTRNYLTHYGKKGVHVLKGGNLITFCRHSQIILEIILLKELGIKKDMIINIINQRMRYMGISKIIS